MLGLEYGRRRLFLSVRSQNQKEKMNYNEATLFLDPHHHMNNFLSLTRIVTNTRRTSQDLAVEDGSIRKLKVARLMALLTF